MQEEVKEGGGGGGGGKEGEGGGSSEGGGDKGGGEAVMRCLGWSPRRLQTSALHFPSLGETLCGRLIAQGNTWGEQMGRKKDETEKKREG